MFYARCGASTVAREHGMTGLDWDPWTPTLYRSKTPLTTLLSYRSGVWGQARPRGANQWMAGRQDEWAAQSNELLPYYAPSRAATMRTELIASCCDLSTTHGQEAFWNLFRTKTEISSWLRGRKTESSSKKTSKISESMPHGQEQFGNSLTVQKLKFQGGSEAVNGKFQ